MNPQHDESDDDIDALLRQSFDGPVDNDGFSERVMQHLPLRHRRIAWPLPVGLLAGFSLCALSLLDAPGSRAAWSSWLTGEWSTSMLTVLSMMAVMALLALVWTLAEAEDH